MYKENCKLPHSTYKLDSQDLKATKELIGVTKLIANKASQFLVVQDSTANSSHLSNDDVIFSIV